MYDSACGLCHRLNQFVLRHDRRGVFRFAALQSPFAKTILARHCASPAELDTVYIVFNHEQPNELLTTRSYAFASVLKQLGSVWWLSGVVLGRIPKFIRDPIYCFVAGRRYKIFAPPESCTPLCQSDPSRFLDV
jgi:predicted DCC family thiol-disulfide oxidoreductase YuxK